MWVRISPLGGDGPRAEWTVSDLGVMAASGNMYVTGDPDRAPIRCTEPTGYAHSGPEAAFAAMTALASGLPQRVDLSMQEVTCRRQHGRRRRLRRHRHAREPTGRQHRPHTRDLADARRVRLVRPARRQGPDPEPRDPHQARRGDDIPGADALVGRDWSTFNQNTASNEELAAIEAPVAAYFAGHTMQELYDIAVETNLMLAPANSPREIYQSAQLAAREFFGPVGDVARFPRSFAITRSPGDEVAPIRPAGGARGGRRHVQRTGLARVGTGRRAGAPGTA